MYFFIVCLCVDYRYYFDVVFVIFLFFFFFFKQKTAYDMRIIDWISDVCSSDLIRIAAGEKFLLRQRDVVFKGHALECRINAEDPFRFVPSPGRITNWHTPGGPGVRIDSHAFNGYFVPPNYDSMIAKVITYGDTRDQALARMRIALSEMVRSEERRVGKEGVSTCRSRLWPEH